ncbi:MAG: hypothetical protein NUV88_03290 [Candidatus Kaiserbacteria bacterium]|nr:hypothetical protein [Candidatus Kaiserbacteria bacterium]
MSKKLAPRGEKEVSELRDVLVRLSEAAQKVEDFISRYKGAGWAANQALMEKSLNLEPCFRGLMKDFHCAMRELQILGRNNLEAQYVVRQMLFDSRSTSVQRILYALLRASQVAKRYLATHPEKKEWEEPGRIFSMILYLSACFDFWWGGYAKKEKARRKALHLDD